MPGSISILVLPFTKRCLLFVGIRRKNLKTLWKLNWLKSSRIQIVATTKVSNQQDLLVFLRKHNSRLLFHHLERRNTLTGFMMRSQRLIIPSILKFYCSCLLNRFFRGFLLIFSYKNDSYINYWDLKSQRGIYVHLMAWFSELLPASSGYLHHSKTCIQLAYLRECIDR